ncbi:hypothetical protein [Rhizobium tumorigenes]|uniref:hypothetical protein n=1 Tax=Rhizobium tumorigenes TaxID=2041385 RepID=UPI00241DBA41|nr:hypothetical protein [Rhizobium tumorigenes]WFS02770.1 hypothetical protein PR016_09285 [Rhizobium tumorigenes]
MSDITYYSAVLLVANTQTDVTGGGLPVNAAGLYFMNVCNDSDVDVPLDAVYLTNGEAAAAQHKIHPTVILPARDVMTTQPLKLGEGFKLFVKASAPVSVQLLGAKED